eukprot:TRINITY_DN92586_c0_g1_i1.p1 TRINITY_DN92586_c0_g1~~TRINITY_DN92586_c0_g1_i1.p1  ORF type:complete len:539 (-),score=122.37 TRINITY_DN92586_c0_g1_i1:192-1808(-)
MTADDGNGPVDSADASPWDLIVVGAGAAGLACARLTSAAGLRVLLVEARDRAGGRAHAADVLDVGAEVDLGASWIHSACTGNPMMKLAHHRKVELVSDGRRRDSSCIVDLTEKAVVKTKAIDKAFAAIEEALEVVAERYEGCEEEEAESMSLAEALLRGDPSLQNDASRTSLLRWALSDEVERHEGADAESLSAAHHAAGVEMPGRNEIPTPSYGAFVQALSSGPLAEDLMDAVSEPTVRLGEAVCRIGPWNEDTPVLVETVKGSTYTARRVVAAIPLGVLKAGSIQFSPALPEQKQRSIKGLGCAAMTKVYLRFEKPFWSASTSFWGIIGTQSESAAELFERSFWLPYPFADGDSKGVVCCLLYGRRARKAEAKTDAEVSEAAMAALKEAVSCAGVKKVLDVKKLRTPKAVHVTRWSSDPYAGQTWTTLPVGSAPSDVKVLAEALGPSRQLSFAGEHTTLNEMGTVHGAWLSGLREAEGILMACLTEGRFEKGACSMEKALKCLLHCRDALATARALHDEEDAASSSSSEDDSSVEE